MKLKAASPFLGLCLAILAVAASPAYAQRSTTAFSAFHVENKVSPNQYACLIEDNGAVVNHCKFAVNLEFNLPIRLRRGKERHRPRLLEGYRHPEHLLLSDLRLHRHQELFNRRNDYQLQRSA